MTRAHQILETLQPRLPKTWNAFRFWLGNIFQRWAKTTKRDYEYFDKLDPKPPVPWKQYVHPDGMLYFFKECQPCNVVTQDNVMDPKILEDLDLNRASLTNDVSQHLKPGHDYELWLTLDEKNHEDFDHIIMDHTAKEVFCCPSSGGAVVEGECSYWEYFSKAPMHHPLPDGAEDEMLLHLTQISGERILGNLRATSPFTSTQCDHLISIYKSLKNARPHSRVRPQDTGVRKWLVSLVMLEVCKSRAKKKRASTSRASTSSPREWNQVVSWLLRIVCFGMHERYSRILFDAYKNGGIQVMTFQQLLGGSLDEWTSSNLLSTVFVSANMAFLAVPGITKAQQTLILVSTYFSIASVMVGVHHLWTHRPKVEADANETIPHLHRAAHDGSRITLTSIFLCLPLVFLLWSVVSFSAALLHYGFNNYKGAPRIILACIVAIAFITSICVVAFFYRTWRGPEITKRATTVRPTLRKQTTDGHV